MFLDGYHLGLYMDSTEGAETTPDA